MKRVQRTAKGALSYDDFEELEGYIEQILQENHNLRRMLYHMTSLTDWLREGYSEDEYNALVKEFESA